MQDLRQVGVKARLQRRRAKVNYCTRKIQMFVLRIPFGGFLEAIVALVVQYLDLRSSLRS